MYIRKKYRNLFYLLRNLLERRFFTLKCFLKIFLNIDLFTKQFVYRGV